MSNSSMLDDPQVHGNGVYYIHGSFEMDGTNAPINVRGTGFSVARTNVGRYTVTLDDAPVEFIAKDCSFEDPSTTLVDGDAKPANENLANGTFEIHVFDLDTPALGDYDGPRINFSLVLRDTDAKF